MAATAVLVYETGAKGQFAVYLEYSAEVYIQHNLSELIRNYHMCTTRQQCFGLLLWHLPFTWSSQRILGFSQSK